MALAILFAIPRMHLLFGGFDLLLRPQYLTQFAIAIVFIAVYFGVAHMLKAHHLAVKMILGLLLSIAYWTIIVRLETLRDPAYGGLSGLVSVIFVPIWLLLIAIGHFKERNAAFIVLIVTLVGLFLLHQRNLLGY